MFTCGTLNAQFIVSFHQRGCSSGSATAVMAVKRGKMSSIAVANNLELVPIPPELSELNVLERQLIAKIVTKMYQLMRMLLLKVSWVISPARLTLKTQILMREEDNAATIIPNEQMELQQPSVGGNDEQRHNNPQRQKRKIFVLFWPPTPARSPLT